MTDISEDQDELTDEEATKRRDEALKRALNTPPKPKSKRGEAETPPRKG